MLNLCKVQESSMQTSITYSSLNEQEHNVRKSLHSLQPSASDPSTLVGSCGALKQKILLKKGGKTDSPIKKSEIKRTADFQDVSIRRSKRNAVLQNNKIPLKSTSCMSENVFSPSNKSSVVKQKSLKSYSKKLISKLKTATPSDSGKDKHTVSIETEIPSVDSSMQGGTINSNSEIKQKSPNSLENGVEVKPLEVTNKIKNSDDCEVQTIASSSEKVPKDVYDLLISDEVPESYWKLLAEQRRIALEKALHENELLHDQLEVLETENRQLNLVVKEAEHLVLSVKGMIGDI